MESSARRRNTKGQSKRHESSGDQGEDEAVEDKRNTSLACYNSYVVFFVYIGSAGFVYLLMYLLFHSFPTPIKKETDMSGKRFCEERARHHLENITKFGPRVAGSYANEVQAKEYLLKEIKTMEHKLHASKRMEIDLQITTGSFQLVDFIQTTFYSVYRNMQNIVVKISGEKESEDSFLINCHFDSVSSSPGIQNFFGTNFKLSSFI
jgi:hypothetical protein